MSATASPPPRRHTEGMPRMSARPPNNAFGRTAGSHSLAAAGQRERYAHQEAITLKSNERPPTEIDADAPYREWIDRIQRIKRERRLRCSGTGGCFGPSGTCLRPMRRCKTVVVTAGNGCPVSMGG